MCLATSMPFLKYEKRKKRQTRKQNKPRLHYVAWYCFGNISATFTFYIE